MTLINLQTDLTSLSFGHDRPGGGSSNQPYIQTEIPENLPVQSPDFLWRNGFLAPVSAAKDVSRLTQMFFDLKSPNGLLFTAKENLLSRISVKTQATKGAGYAGGTINQGVYTPTSTIAQALVGFTGTHLNLLGLDPSSPMAGVVQSGLFPGGGLVTYESAVNRRLNGVAIDLPNRLIDLYYFQQEQEGDDVVNILSYPGGPNSISGIGKTHIKFADQRTGVNSGKDFKTYQVNQKGYDPSLLPKFYSPRSNSGTFGGQEVGVSWIYSKNIGVLGTFGTIFSETNEGRNGKFARLFETSVYSAFPAVTNRVKDNNSLTWNQKQIAEVPNKNSTQGYTDPTTQDFRKPLLKDKESSTIMSIAPSYDPSKNKTIDGANGSRINYTSPGQKGNIINYTKGKILPGQTKPIPVDKINAEPIYQSFNVTTDKVKNDLVKFRIAAINNTPESGQFKKQFIHFRAYIDSFSDSYNGSWDAINYMGRGESFYKYNNFKRNISLAFTVAAQSKEELIPMYKKLNFLASNLAPSYSDAGYMAGSLVELTMGGWCYELPGFITAMTLDVPQESPWEIGINETGGYDSSVKELPHIVKVTGFGFTPIEKFRPAKQVNEFNDNGKLTSYGDERYIALEAGGRNNYDNL